MVRGEKYKLRNSKSFDDLCHKNFCQLTTNFNNFLMNAPIDFKLVGNDILEVFMYSSYLK
jgi:hypothetical protein